MDHASIQEHNLIERYHQGSLPPDEEARFEEHFVDCQECQEELEMARGFRIGLRTMVAEDAARQAVRVGLFAWLARRSRASQWGLVAAALLATLALPAVWFALETRELRSTAKSAESVVAALEERYESERETVAQLRERLTEEELRAAEARSEFADRLEEVAADDDQRSELLERLRQPLVNTPVFILSTMRSEGAGATQLDLEQLGDWLSLAVDVDDNPSIESYRVELVTAGGSRLWRRAGLLPNNLETLMVTFPASFFTPGEYVLRVEGQKVEGGFVEIESYSFKVS